MMALGRAGTLHPRAGRQPANNCSLIDSCADMTADYCLPPEQQRIFNGLPEGEPPPAAQTCAAHSAAYRLDEDRRLAEALQHLQAATGQEPAAGNASDVQAVAQGALPLAQLVHAP